MHNIAIFTKSIINYRRLIEGINFKNIKCKKYIDTEEISDFADIKSEIKNNYELLIVEENYLYMEQLIEYCRVENLGVIFFNGDFSKTIKEVINMLNLDEKDCIIEEQVKRKKVINNLASDSKKRTNFNRTVYVTKKIIEKETEYKHVYTGIKNKLIAVLSLSEKAGASFFTLNMAKALAESKVLTAIIEPPLKKPYLFDTVGLEQRIEDLDFYSYTHIINENMKIEKNKETIEDGIIWYVVDPREKLIKNWDYQKMMKLIYTCRKATITFIDYGSTFDNELVQETLNEMDMVIVLIDALPCEVLQNIEKFYKLKELKEKGYPIKFIFNKWNKGIDKKKVLNFLDIEPDMYIPYVPIEYVYKSIYDCNIPYSYYEVKEVLEEPFNEFIKKLIPKEIINNKNDNRSFLSRVNNLFKYKKRGEINNEKNKGI